LRDLGAPLCAASLRSSSVLQGAALAGFPMPPRKRARTQGSAGPEAHTGLRLGCAKPTPDRLRDSLAAMQLTGQLCDIEIECEGRTFKAHRVLLASESEYMAALVTGPFSEAGAAKVELKEMRADVFEHALGFMYNATRWIASTDLLQPLLEAACRLQVSSLKDAAEGAMVEKLTPDNSANALNIADHFSLPRLAAAAKSVMLRDMAAVIRSDGFGSIPADSMSALLADDALYTKDEVVVFEAAAAWVDAQEAPPPDVCEDLLSHVRFSMLPHAFVKSIVETHPLVRAHPMVLATAFREAFNREQTPRNRQRSCNDWRPMIVTDDRDVREGLVIRLVAGDHALERIRAMAVGMSDASITAMVGVPFEIFGVMHCSFQLQHPASEPECAREQCFCKNWHFCEKRRGASAFEVQPPP